MKQQRRWVSDDEAKKMIALYRAGLSTNEVGRAIGRSRGTVKAVMDRLGEPLRPPHPRGPANKMFKGHTRDSRGYVYVRIYEDDPLHSMTTKCGRVFEHRLVMARHLGRPLQKDEHVHHINGERSDNRIENLQLVRINHPAGVRLRCRDCGSTNVTAIKLKR